MGKCILPHSKMTASYNFKRRIHYHSMSHVLLWLAFTSHVHLAHAVMASYRASVSTLSFNVCNGFTNQRLSVVYGFTLAKMLGRQVILPRLILDGITPGAKLSKVQQVLNSAGGFFDFYDQTQFEYIMQYAGVKYLRVQDVEMARAMHLNLTSHVVPQLSTKYAMARHIVVSCPLLKIPRHVLEQEGVLVTQLVQALKPSIRWKRVLDKGARQLNKLGPGGYNVLHLRLENDWLQHCSQPNMASHTNCVVKMNDLHARLKANGFSTQIPLYVASQWSNMDKQLALGMLKRLKDAGFKIQLQHKLFKKCAKRFTREEAAMLDYYLALGARNFAGNSVSTFSAMVMWERKQLYNLTSWHYNGGGIPLARYVPGFGVEEPEEIPDD